MALSHRAVPAPRRWSRARPSPSRMAARSRGAKRSSARRPRARAMSGAPFSVARMRARSAAVGAAGRPPRRAARRSARLGQRAAEPVGQQPGAGRGHGAVHRGEQAVPRAAALATQDFQAAPRRRIHLQHAAAAARHGAGEMRQGAGCLALLGGADIVERHGGGGRFAGGETAETFQRGDAIGLGQPAGAVARHAGLDRAGQPRVAGASTSAGSSRASRAGRSAAPAPRSRRRRCRGRARRRPAGLALSWRASASSQAGRAASSRVSSVIVPGVTSRTTSRRTARGAAALGLLRRLHLLGDGDAEAAADQPRQVALMAMRRHAAHRHLGALVLAAISQRDVERLRGRFRIGEEHLEEVAHAEEQDRVRLRRFQREPLRHGGGGAGCGQHAGGGIGGLVHAGL